MRNRCPPERLDLHPNKRERKTLMMLRAAARELMQHCKSITSNILRRNHDKTTHIKTKKNQTLYKMVIELDKY